MRRFLHGHATHPDWRVALALSAAQIEAQRREQERPGAPTLGWAYFTDHYAPQAAALLAELRQRWPGVDWIGSSGVGIAAGGVEYFDEPALSLLMADLPHDRFRVFSGAAPLRGFAPSTAQVLHLHVHRLQCRQRHALDLERLDRRREHLGVLLEPELHGAQLADAFLELFRIERGCDPLADAGQRRARILDESLQEIEPGDELCKAGGIGHRVSCW